MRSKTIWSHKCEHCGRIYSDYRFGDFSLFICEDCRARMEALKLPVATAVADSFLSLPMTPDSAWRGTKIEEPRGLSTESLLRGQEQAARVARNRGMLRRWKKKP